MKRRQPKPVAPSGVTEQQAASAKPNRLSRSYRPSQQTQVPAQLEPPRSQQSELKTPTRRFRPGPAACRSSSPHNDSDLQQDIIWDATSPSPHRPGKRGRRQPARVVDISEIVNRIAPKHGRPEASEWALQQWIRDSAAIPCTPDVQVPKPRRSPRWSGAGDLLKLARQFDFMFHQEDEDVLPPAAAAEEAVPPLDDDLDLLFAGATQQVGGALSPAPSGADSSSLRSAAADVEGTLAGHALQDDWGDDDLLDDSLLLEVTQNPHRFSPEFCSTQKGPGRRSPAGIRLVSGPASSAGSVQMSSDAQQNRVLSGRVVGSEWTRPVTPERQEPGSSSAEPDQNLSAGSWRPAGDDLLPLLPDPVWDDPADDQLLCELCEDLENQLQKQRPTSTQQRAALQPANRNLRPPSSTSPARGWVRTGSQPAPKTSAHHGQFTFKKPVKPVSFKGKGGGVGGGVGAGLGWGAPPSASAAAPCSAAEIEQKKQRAIQRRRRRLQLAQGPGPPT